MTVIELPADPMGYAAAVLDCAVLERVSLTDEDRRRDRLYAEQRERAELRQTATSLEDFLRSLQMEMTMGPVEPASVARVAQLTQKTNQFNLTTRRYSEQEIRTLAAAPDVRVYEARVSDRFGDSGLVGVAIARAGGGTWEIDTLLLSCRVIGRGVETAMVARLADDARAAGAPRLGGWFLPTKKNTPASGFYASHGFSLVESSDGGTRWEIDLGAASPRCPEWIALR